MTDGTLDFFDPKDSKDLQKIRKIERIIRDSITKINLDLSGITVLTEAATGNWAFTPFIAALADAKSVICFTKDSKYGKAKEITQNFKKLSKYFKVENKIHVHDVLSKEIIGKADVVTNSGLLRPITTEFIKSMKRSAVISLMWEPWEFREKELDLFTCKKRGIAVLGVNEDNETMNVMKYNGENLLKVLSANNVQIKNKNVILVMENNSALYQIKPLISNGANLLLVSKLIQNKIKNYGKIIGSDLKNKSVIPFLKNCDLIIINSEPLKKKIIGGKTGLSISILKKLCPKVKILVYFGNVDYHQLTMAKIECYPSQSPGIGYMSWTLDFLGPQPTLQLNALGLKVGELLAKHRLAGISQKESIKSSLENTVCLDFTKKQKTKFYGSLISSYGTTKK